MVIFIGIGCSQSSDPDINKLSRVYVDLLISEQQNLSDSNNENDYRDSVFVKYKLTEEEYLKELNDLEIDQDKWNKFFGYSKKYLDSLKNSRSIN